MYPNSSRRALSEYRLYTAFQETRYQGKVTIHYPYHAFFCREFKIARQCRRGSESFLEIVVGDSHQFIPEWMADKAFCEQLAVVEKPAVSLACLRELRSLLEAMERSSAAGTMDDLSTTDPKADDEVSNTNAGPLRPDPAKARGNAASHPMRSPHISGPLPDRVALPASPGDGGGR